MNTRKLAGAVAAIAMTMGVGAATAAPAFATDNIKTFGEQERLNNPNGTPYIGYTVGKLAPSNDPVPHNGKLYAASLVVDGFGTGTPAMIERFGARAENSAYYPSIWGASNMSKLYFDVVGEVPNSVVWNDGVRDILAWVPGEQPLEPANTPPMPEPVPEQPAPVEAAAAPEGGMPVESSGNLGEATPNVIAPAPFELSEADVASPGFHG